MCVSVATQALPIVDSKLCVCCLQLVEIECTLGTTFLNIYWVLRNAKKKKAITTPGQAYHTTQRRAVIYIYTTNGVTLGQRGIPYLGTDPGCCKDSWVFISHLV